MSSSEGDIYLRKTFSSHIEFDINEWKLLNWHDSALILFITTSKEIECVNFVTALSRLDRLRSASARLVVPWLRLRW